MILIPFRGLAEKTNNPVLKICYSFIKPDGDDFWRVLNHDDSRWRKAHDASEIAAAVAKEKPAEVYVRIEVNHTPETLNNFYFRMRNSGSVDIYVNGLKSGGGTNIASEMRDYTIQPRRVEMLGKNLYAIHFINSLKGDSFFDLQIKDAPWVTTDDGFNDPAPVINDLMRDAEVCYGGDGAWYLTGTTGDDTFLKPNPNYWLINPGIQVFRSADLKSWKSLGYIWTFDRDGTWNKDFGTFAGRGPARGIFAPEIKYHKGKYWINYSVNNSNEKHSFGIGLLCSDKPEGPYIEMSPEKPISDGFDSNVFFDDDDAVYLLKHGGEIARLKDDHSGVAEPFRHLTAANYPSVGYEGVHLFKYKDIYYLTSAEWNVHKDGTISYDSMIASSTNIYGPYGNRYCALRYGGHNGYFQGPNNEWYATVWCYPDQDKHWQRVSIVKMILGKDGLFKPALEK